MRSTREKKLTNDHLQIRQRFEDAHKALTATIPAAIRGEAQKTKSGLPPKALCEIDGLLAGVSSFFGLITPSNIFQSPTSIRYLRDWWMPDFLDAVCDYARMKADLCTKRQNTTEAKRLIAAINTIPYCPYRVINPTHRTPPVSRAQRKAVLKLLQDYPKLAAFFASPVGGSMLPEDVAKYTPPEEILISDLGTAFQPEAKAIIKQRGFNPKCLAVSLLLDARFKDTFKKYAVPTPSEALEQFWQFLQVDSEVTATLNSPRLFETDSDRETKKQLAEWAARQKKARDNLVKEGKRNGLKKKTREEDPIRDNAIKSAEGMMRKGMTIRQAAKIAANKHDMKPETVRKAIQRLKK